MTTRKDDIPTRAGKTLVLGMGNTLATDDGVGIHVVRRLKEILRHGSSGSGDLSGNDDIKNSDALSGRVDIKETAVAGPELIVLLEGYASAIIVDAVKTQNCVPGQAHVLDLNDFSETRNTTSPHSLNLFTAVELGRITGLSMPEKITIVAIEVSDVENVCETCTPQVAVSIDNTTCIIKNILTESGY